MFVSDEMEKLLGEMRLFDIEHSHCDYEYTLSKKELNLLLSHIDGQKERIEYLERSNNRKQDTIVSFRDELIFKEIAIDNVVELIKARIKENEGHINARMEIYHYKNMLRMLGEIE